jgi:hypothetical protein
MGSQVLVAGHKAQVAGLALGTCPAVAASPGLQEVRMQWGRGLGAYQGLLREQVRVLLVQGV